MWANSVWGLFGLGVTFFLTRIPFEAGSRWYVALSVLGTVSFVASGLTLVGPLVLKHVKPNTTLQVLGMLGSVAMLALFAAWYHYQPARSEPATELTPAPVNEGVNAMSKEEEKPTYSIGSISGNQGIITQGQVGDNTIINQAPKPVLTELGRREQALPDGTYKIERDYEMNGPYAGSLVVSVSAPGIVSAAFGSVRQVNAGGNVLMITGGGMQRNVIQAENFWTATEPTPSGRYLLSVVTRTKTSPDVQFTFQ